MAHFVRRTRAKRAFIVPDNHSNFRLFVADVSGYTIIKGYTKKLKRVFGLHQKVKNYTKKLKRSIWVTPKS